MALALERTPDTFDLFDILHGGAARGAALAETLWRYLPLAPRTVDIGCGAGVVAEAVGADGRWVAGVDLSAALVRRAARRLDGAAVRADALALPLALGAVDAAFVVWLQVVPEAEHLMAEAARVLRPGGRLVVVTGRPETGPGDDVGSVERRLDALVPPSGRPSGLALAGVGAGLRLVERTYWRVTVEQAPEVAAAALERRDLGALWGVDEGTSRWVVRSSAEELRRLPDPARPRPRRLAFPLLAFEKPPGSAFTAPAR